MGAEAASEADALPEEDGPHTDDGPRARVHVALSLGLAPHPPRAAAAPHFVASAAAAACANAAKAAYAAAAEAAAAASAPRPVDLPTLAGQRFDNPARIRALLEPEPAGVPLSSLAEPKLNSSTL
eukprot:scaffold91002_cov21-Phaeocystis_antarctica.AAC.1